MNLKHLIQELKRRNVFKVATTYAIAGWLIIQVVTSVFPAFKFPAWTSQFVIMLVFIGFPISIILAWAFELTPDGVKRTEEVPQDKSIARITGRKLNNIVIILLVLAVGVLSYKLFFTRQMPVSGKGMNKRTASDSLAIPPKSIAVLPFVNDSHDSSNQYFSDGLSEELIIALNQYPGLKVIGRESSFQFRGRDLDSRLIGRKLGVAHLLEGSVSREGHEVRIRAELVSTNDGSMIWSDHYDRQYKDLFSLQDAITKTVAKTLKAKILGYTDSLSVAQSNRPASGNLKAYNAYLEGNFYLERVTEKDFMEAINYYKKAIHQDTSYVAAYAALSYTWSRLAAGFRSGDAMLLAYKKAEKAAKTALKLDPDSWAAHWAYGYWLNYNMQWVKAKTESRRALALAPNYEQTLNLSAAVNATLGNLKKAVDLMNHSLQVNPLDASGYYSQSYYLGGLNQPGKAIKVIRQAITLQPKANAFHAELVLLMIQQGGTDSLLYEANRESNPGWSLLAHTWAYTALGKQAQADSLLQNIIKNFSGIAAYQIAETYALMKKPTEAFSWLNRAWKQHDPGISELLYDPLFLVYKHDPRFTAFCKKVGLPPPASRKSSQP